MAETSEAQPTPTPAERPARPLGKRIKRWTIGLLLLALLVVVAIRIVPTATYDGYVQRVYEKTAEYRLEFVTDQGEVRVFTNREQRFPYLKFDTADLQANLEKHQRDGDRVRVTAWGIRSAMISAFPNVVDVELLARGSETAKGEDGRVVEAVMAALEALDLIPADREAEVRGAVQRALEATRSKAPGQLP